MALKTLLDLTDIGATFPEAYIRVIGAPVCPDTSDITCLAYVDQAARQTGKSPLRQFVISAPQEVLEEYFAEALLKQEGISPRKQAYELLKTLPEFVEATDC